MIGNRFPESCFCLIADYDIHFPHQNTTNHETSFFISLPMIGNSVSEMSLYLPICRNVTISPYLQKCHYISLSAEMSLYLPICRNVTISPYLQKCHYISLSAEMSLYLPICRNVTISPYLQKYQYNLHKMSHGG